MSVLTTIEQFTTEIPGAKVQVTDRQDGVLKANFTAYLTGVLPNSNGHSMLLTFVDDAGNPRGMLDINTHECGHAGVQYGGERIRQIPNGKGGQALKSERLPEALTIAGPTRQIALRPQYTSPGTAPDAGDPLARADRVLARLRARETAQA